MNEPTLILVCVSVGLNVFLILERWQYGVRMDQQRASELRSQRDAIMSIVDQINKANEGVMDRLMARSLTEVKSWQIPPAPEAIAEEADPDWMKPSFAMPVEDLA